MNALSRRSGNFGNDTLNMKCRLCGKTALQIGGYLHRVNAKGIAGIWECRPSCDAKLSNEQALFAALEYPAGPSVMQTDRSSESCSGSSPAPDTFL